ncbi:coiled-coil-helix-coiled-coil-helix domain-containing protein 7 [Onthophagus taurus]|uniref:coiled-coil-helix-coiled-coil-helix domain-containing protein 7 n=1 Tax=Onthophagus taurus TaxID=166361 RepID=UPI000C20C18E|nr:coiled-coil-helix-coiled-coil-helix domain-containing protein 7 [Onthophagus taurus]
MRNNFDQEKHNPCLKEQELTIRCFNDNNFVKEKCAFEMENYKICKGFWFSVKAERRRKGIKPYLPPVEEREQIKKDYFAQFKQ